MASVCILGAFPLNVFTWAFSTPTHVAHAIGLLLAIVLYGFIVNEEENVASARKSGAALFWRLLFFLGLCGCEIYAFGIGHMDPTWYLSSIKSFFLGLLYIAVFAGVLYTQFKSLWAMTDSCAAIGGFSANYMIGGVGVVVTILTWIVLSFTHHDEIRYAAWVLGVSQVLQLLYLLITCVSQRGNLLMALLAFLIYAMGISVFTFTLVKVVMLAIVAVLVGIVFTGFASGTVKGALSGGSNKNGSSEIPWIKEPTRHIDHDTVETESGIRYKRVREGLSSEWVREDLM
ncbi:MAG: hypothetical protein IJ064_02160 [Bacteroidaceae bacterium]|nr:hypothetical protein [Bacteroidaceae bacterium]